jgi:hypothetical protein
MRTKLRSKFTLLLIVCAVLIAVPGAAALAQDTGTSPAPTIQSDKADYAPGETVTLTGSNWQPGEAVHINVNDAVGQTWIRDVDVTADQSGNVTDQFQLPSTFVAVYNVKATGSSGAVATASFTDANVVVRARNGANALVVTFPANSVQRFNNLTCTAPAATGASTSNPQFSTPSNANQYQNTSVQADNTQSVRLTAPSPVTIGSTTYNFSSWTADANTVQVTGQPDCFKASGNGAWNLTANYTAAPTVAPTTLSVDPASGTYDGTVDLKTKLTKTSDSTNVSGKTITFSLRGTSVCDNDGTTPKPDCPTTDANGVATLTGVSLSGINAGGPTGTGYAGAVSASFAGDSGFSASNGSNNLTVNKASSTTAVTCPTSVTYTGNPITPCTANVTGAGGLNQPVPVNHADNTNAGTATASASFAGDANHNGSSDSKNFTIGKASSTTTVTCPTSVTYTGNPLTPCSANVSGAGGLNQPVPVNYTNNTDAGTATASASYAGDANHNNSSDSETFIISFNFTGFSSPVDNNNVLNTAKAGQAIPLKWRLTDASGNPVTNLLSTDVKVSVANYSCGLSTTTDLLEEYAAGSSGLQNLGNGYYQFNWKTPTNYANSCKTMTLDLGEGTLTTPHTALFKFTK